MNAMERPVELLNSCSKKTYKARKNTLKKKAGELAKLCDVEVCVICYGSDGNVDLWPEDSDKVKSIIARYNEVAKKGNPKRKADLNLSDLDLDMDLPSNGNKKKKMKMDHDDDDKNSEKGIAIWDEQLRKLPKEGLIGLSNYLEAKVQNLGDKINQFFMTKAKEEEEKQLFGEISTHHCDHEFPSWSDILSMIAFAESSTDNSNMVDNLLCQPSHLSLGVPVDYSDGATTLVPSESTIFTNNINEVAYYPEIGTTSCSTSNANASVSSDSYWSQLLGVNYLEADEDFGAQSFLMDEYYGITNSNNYGTTTGFEKDVWSENTTTSTSITHGTSFYPHSHDDCGITMLQPNSCFGSSSMDELGLKRSLNNADNFSLDNSRYESSGLA